MMREFESREENHTGAAAEETVAAEPPRSLRTAKWKAIVHAATQWNASHPQLVAEFNRLTGGSCVGDHAGVSVRAVRIWQMEHGLKPDGKIGGTTVDAARAESRSKSDSEVSARSAANATGSLGKEQPEEEGNADGLADEIVAEGETGGQERREREDPEETKKEAGNELSEDAEAAGEAVGAHEKLEHIKGGKGALKLATQIARLPQVIHLVKHGKYREAVRYVRDGLGFSDYVEVVKLAAEHCGIGFGEIAAKAPWLVNLGEGVALGAEAADVVMVGIRFQYEALEALAKAREAGERDNRVYLYSEAWANAFLYGSYDNPGAITGEQREAVVAGVSDGKKTAGNCGERAADIARQLLKHYGDEENVKHALIDALYKRAGIGGIKTHEDKQ